MSTDPILSEPETICFGLDRQTDLQSLAAYLRRFSSDEFLAVMLPRLTEEDIGDTIEFLTGIMKKHCTEKEYHSIFLRSGQQAPTIQHEAEK